MRGRAGAVGLGAELHVPPARRWSERCAHVSQRTRRCRRPPRRDARDDRRNDTDRRQRDVSPIDGESLEVDARYLIGCDGGGSSVRRALGDRALRLRLRRALARHRHDRRTTRAGLPPFGLQICDPKRPTTVMPMAPRPPALGVHAEARRDARSDARRRARRALLAPWVERPKCEIVRKAVYRFHGLVAKEWRRGRVLLAGDAAHQMPPFVGPRHVLGHSRRREPRVEARAWCSRGDADARLLDTYQAERDPHVRAIIELAIAMGRVVCTLDPVEARARDAEMAAAHRLTGTDGVAPPPQPGLSAGVIHPSPGAGEIFPQPIVESTRGLERRDERLTPGFCLVTRAAFDGRLPSFVTAVPAADLADTTLGWLERSGR